MTNNHDSPIFSAVGTTIGAIAGLFNSQLLNNILETALLAFIGAVVGFLTTAALKHIFKKK